MARCPGQDQRFWKIEDIFEVDCPQCDCSVEFWKDEPQVKCPNCKQVIVNPKLDLGCAEWCQYAKECLGQMAGEESAILSTRLIECLREMADTDQNIVRSSLEVLRYAEKIQLEEGGQPLVVKASAILSQIHQLTDRAKPEIQAEDAGDGQNSLISNILTKQGIKNEFTEHICRILNACRCNKNMDSLEFKIVSDAQRLSKLNLQIEADPSTEIKGDWKTATAQRFSDNMSQS